jgi:peptidoglycan-N-acetylmuramic acid deacetylase
MKKHIARKAAALISFLIVLASVFPLSAAAWSPPGQPQPSQPQPSVPPQSQPPACVKTIDTEYVCLTVDDGWSKKIITNELDVLKKNDVKCTFFVIGSRLNALPEVWQRAIKEGHEICYHSMYHKSVLHMNEKQIKKDVKDWENAAHKALGKDYVIKRFARLPGGSGSSRESIRTIYAKMGYTVIYWSMDTLSHRKNIVSYIKKKTKGGAVILTHFNGSDSKALSKYIGWLKDKFKLCRISDVLKEIAPQS